GVGDDRADLGSAGERRLEPRQLVGAPDVVLIGERDEVAAAVRDGRLEILRPAEPLAVEGEAHGKLRLGGEGAKDVGRAVGGAIVADDQLVGPARLRRDRGKLRLQVAGAIVGAHRDRERRSGAARRRILLISLANQAGWLATAAQASGRAAKRSS